MSVGPSTSDAATLVTGASGFLGGLVAASLLAEEQRRLLLPIRASASVDACRERIRHALLDLEVPAQRVDELMQLVTLVELPELDRFGELDSVASSTGVDEIVHCAGCVDYFDTESLQLGNIELTSRLAESGRRWGVRRFVFLSTAYCSGYQSGIIHERLHPDPDPADEPTDYTRSKRIAERRVAESGLPFLIVRASNVIGDSRTGKYTGKNYGLYQMWRAIEGLLCREYYPIWYTVAPDARINFLHQDAFQTGFMRICRDIPSDSVVHLVGDDSKGPTMRQMAWLWANVYWPVEIHSYARVDDVPLRSIPTRQRRFLELAATNIEIATRPWRFETGHLDRLRAAGLPFVDATLDTISRCQRRYVEGSERIREHMLRYARLTGEPPRFIDMSSAAHPEPGLRRASTG